MKKKLLNLILIAIILIILIVAISYSSSYNITNDVSIIENNIKRIINKHNEDIEIKEELNLYNKKYILLTIDNYLGEAVLKRGVNGKLKIESVTYGTNFFKHNIYKTDNGKYMVLKGINPEMKIHYIRVVLDSKEYIIDIPQDNEYFIAYCKVPNNTLNEYIEIDKVTFFDKNYIDITSEVSL